MIAPAADQRPGPTGISCSRAHRIKSATMTKYPSNPMRWTTANSYSRRSNIALCSSQKLLYILSFFAFLHVFGSSMRSAGESSLRVGISAFISLWTHSMISSLDRVKPYLALSPSKQVHRRSHSWSVSVSKSHGYDCLYVSFLIFSFSFRA